jgi:hypothetical protein
LICAFNFAKPSIQFFATRFALPGAMLRAGKEEELHQELGTIVTVLSSTC